MPGLRRSVVLLGALVTATAPPAALASRIQSEPRTFEVASIRENLGPGSAVFKESPGSVVVQSATVTRLVAWAFQVPERDVVGGPDWVRTRRFDVNARVEGEIVRSDLRTMMKGLLVERFGVRVEPTRMERPVYHLVLGRGDRRPGPALKVSTSPCSWDYPAPGFEALQPQKTLNLRLDERCGIAFAIMGGQAFGRRITLVFATRSTMRKFAEDLSRQLDRPVIDRTDLAGEFDFVVDTNKVVSETGGAAVDADVRFFVALEEQLGLRLTPSRGLAEVLAIREVRLPTED